MQEFRSATTLPLLGLILGLPGLGGCNTYAPTTGGTGSTLAAKPISVTDEERDCLGRAMYFESNRSDPEGLLAVGTVVMNRLEAAAFPNGGICAVVGQPRQFAPGVLTRKMEGKELEKVAEVTDAVLDGQRHPKLGRTMHFHTAGLRFPYNNMHYVAVAGGNAFYEKRKPGAGEPAAPPPTALAFAAVPPPVMPAASAIPAASTPQAAAPVAATPAASAPVRATAPVRLARAPAEPKPVATAPAKPSRSRLALTPAALAPEPPPPPVLNLPRP
ncbi:cell wall hydrolase [Methylobacterium flocculans]|uniref:cell wall hydrolase n=1 Tax=Methylobacterium flocculans TaxID=2984843 RepID=UPI0021F26C84|nr:cell wall hydrolase [Methylobacterium sp. FF17]